jgi:hypothetical protein
MPDAWKKDGNGLSITEAGFYCFVLRVHRGAAGDEKWCWFVQRQGQSTPLPFVAQGDGDSRPNAQHRALAAVRRAARSRRVG